MSTPSTPTSLLRHRDFVRAVARHLIADDHQRDDVEQETWLAAIERPPRSERPTAWLRSTVKRVSGKWFRGEGRRRAREMAAGPRDPVPSPQELVERIELEQEVVCAVTALREPYRETILLRYHEGLTTREIAARLGTTHGAIRARLSRGIREVRASLDGTFGGRDGWMAGLVLVASIPSSARTTTTTTPTTTTTTTAGSLKVVVAAACVALVTGSIWLATGSDGDGDRSDDGTPARPARLGAAAIDPTPATEPPPDVGAQRTLASAAVEDVGASDASAARPRGIGTVVLEVVDAETGDPIDDATLRFLAADRFAESRVTSRVRERLSAASYEISLCAPGYDDVRVGIVDVAADRHHDLGRIPMRLGSGLVAGYVDASAALRACPIVVELRGNVRGGPDVDPERLAPSEAHELNEEAAGLDDDATSPAGPITTPAGLRRVVATAGDRFQFDGLPGGTYWVRAVSRLAPHAPYARVDLPSGGHREVPLTLAPASEQTFVVSDAEGRPLDVMTPGGDGDDAGWLSFEFRDDANERSFAYCEIGLPIEVAFEDFTTSTSVDVSTEPAPPIDRERQAEDGLFPRPAAPLPGAAFLAGRQTAPGTFVVSAVPAGTSSIHVAAHGIGEASFALRTPAGPVRVVLRPAGQTDVVPGHRSR